MSDIPNVNSTIVQKRPCNDMPEEHRGNPLIERLGPLVLAEDRLHQISRYPHIVPEERNLTKVARMQRVFRLNRYFEALPPHFEVIDLIGMTLRDGYVARHPGDLAYRELRYALRKNETFSWEQAMAISPATAPSFALFGVSGVGKSTVVETALSLVPKTIIHQDFVQVVWIKLDCPPDGSLKQLLENLLQKIDAEIGTSYGSFLSGTHTLDALILKVAKVCGEHYLGMLIIDEIQHLLEAKGAYKSIMFNFFVTFANVVKIPVVTIGTTRALSMLEATFREARRVGDHGTFVWNSMNPGEEWRYFIEGLWEYQWTKEYVPLTNEILNTLYENTMGIHALVVRLFQLTQLHVISNEQIGAEHFPVKISKEIIKEVATQKFKLVKPMLDALKKRDLAKIMKYEDLLAKQLDESTLSVENQVGIEQLKNTKQLRNQESAERLRATSALVSLGYDEDFVQPLISSVFSENPKLSSSTAVSIILKTLAEEQHIQEGQPEYVELRTIIQDANQKGITAHDALKVSGVIKKSEMD